MSRILQRIILRMLGVSEFTFDEQCVRQILQSIVELLSGPVEETPNEIDDAILKAIGTVLENDEVFSAFFSVVEMMVEQQTPLPMGCPQALDRPEIDWNRLKEIAEFVLQIIAMFV